MDFCDELKIDLQVTQNIFKDFENAVSKKKFDEARVHRGSAVSFVDHLQKRVEVFSLPAELIRVKLFINTPNVLSYTGIDRLQCKAYNIVISKLLTNHGLSANSLTKTTGKQTFELSFDSPPKRPISDIEHTLRTLIPTIHEFAEKEYKKLLKELMEGKK